MYRISTKANEKKSILFEIVTTTIYWNYFGMIFATNLASLKFHLRSFQDSASNLHSDLLRRIGEWNWKIKFIPFAVRNSFLRNIKFKMVQTSRAALQARPMKLFRFENWMPADMTWAEGSIKMEPDKQHQINGQLISLNSKNAHDS